MMVLSSSKRRLVQGFLAATLVCSSFLTPFAGLTQSVAAQGVTASDGVLAVVGATAASFYAAPGGEVLGTLPTGSVVTAIGRTADNAWVEVVSERGDTGWVETGAVVAFGLNRLPVTDGSTTLPAAADSPAATVAAPAATATATAVPPTATPTATSTPTKTPVPTATPVPPTATPSPVPTVAKPVAPAKGIAPATGILAIVGGAGADLFATPDGEKGKSLGIADALTVTGRNAATDWLYATTADGEVGWVLAKAVVAFGVENLPVVSGEAGQATEAATTETAVTPETQAAAETGPAPSKETDVATAATSVTAILATVTLTDARLNIRSGPDASFGVAGKAAPGEELAATGRTAAGDWVRVERTDLPGGAGWVATQFLSFAAPVDSLPVEADATESDSAAAGTPATTAAGNGSALLNLPTPTPTPASAPAAALPPALAAQAITLAEPAAIKAQAVPGLSGRIAFQDGRNNIYIYDLASGNVRWLTNGFEPDISRDGSKVTFVRGGGVDNGIWIINVDGSGAQKIYGGGEIMRSPKWKPDGSLIVFSRNSGSYRCWDLQPFLGCVSFHELQAMFPEIPPAILFQIFLKDEDRVEFPNWGISRVNPFGGGGGDLKKLEFRDINALDSAIAPDWNEAGIVYQAAPGLEITQDTTAVIEDPDDPDKLIPAGQTRSVFHGEWDGDPDWAPNGGRILYQSKEGSHWEIWTVNPDGTGIVALTRPETTLVEKMPSNVAGAYSPDGQHIVYLSSRTDDEEDGPWRLWVMNADGSNKRPLPIDTTIEYGYGSAQVASWGN